MENMTDVLTSVRKIDIPLIYTFRQPSSSPVIYTQTDGALADHKAGCDPNCPKILFHVCGTDRITYNNECLLNLEACKSGKWNSMLEFSINWHT